MFQRILVKDLSFYYRRDTQTFRLQINDFTAKRGEAHCILGPNASGKTTFIKLCVGLLVPYGGFIAYYIDGEPYYPDIDSHRVKITEYLGYLPEGGNLPQHLSVYRVLDRHLSFYLADKVERRRRINELLDELNLTEFKSKPIGKLSYGTQRRVALAMSISHLIDKPGILILDEPLKGLDTRSMDLAINILKKLRKNHAIIFSTHDERLAEEIATHLTVLRDGKVIESGRIENIIRKYSSSCMILEVRKGDPGKFIDELERMAPVVEARSPLIFVQADGMGEEIINLVARYIERGYIIIVQKLPFSLRDVRTKIEGTYTQPSTPLEVRLMSKKIRRAWSKFVKKLRKKNDLCRD